MRHPLLLITVLALATQAQAGPQDHVAPAPAMQAPASAVGNA